MKIYLSCIVIFFLFLYNHATAQTADITQGCIPLEVQFTAPPGTASWYWEFQDGASSTLENPINTFTTPGTYEVEFSQTVGGSVEGTITIEAYPVPDVNISATPVFGCTPLNVAFLNETQIPDGVTVTNYEWVFGDGGNVAGVETPSHTYTTAGDFTISLSVETNLSTCNITEVFDNFVHVSNPPNVFFTTDPSPASACEPPLNVAFQNGSSSALPLTYEWDFDNGTSSTEFDPPAQDYTQNGDFEVTLTAVDSNMCTNSYTTTISIGEPVASFIVPQPLCVGDLVRFENTSPTGFMNWNFGPNATPSTSVQYSPFVTFDTEGTYAVTLSILSVDGQCSDDTTVMVLVDQADATFVTDPSYTCYEPRDIAYHPVSDELSAWQWTFQDGSTSTDADPIHTFVNPDTTTYGINGVKYDTTFLLGTNPSGCSAIYMNIDSFHLPNALFLPSTIDGCVPLEVTFTDTSSSREQIVLWEWDYGDGTTASFTNGDNHSHTYTDPGTYWVGLIITNDAGCTDTSFLQKIVAGHNITPDFTADKTVVCPGEEVTFTDLTNDPNITVWHYTTDGGRLWHCQDEPNPSHSFITDCGPMDVTLTVGYNGCYTETTKPDFIFVKGPIAHLNFQTNCIDPYSVAFTNNSCDATNLIWDFGDGNTSAEIDPVHTYANTGDYVVTLTAENDTSGCVASMDDYNVYIRDLKSEFTLERDLCKGVPYALNGGMSQDVNDYCSKGFTWFFSDPLSRPITTDLQNVQHEFNATGEQTVTLMVEDVNGCFDTSETVVKVFEVNADFNLGDDLICFPTEVQMTNLSVADTSIAGYTWNFGDGEFSAEESPLHGYTSSEHPDTIFIELAVVDSLGCVDTSRAFIPIYSPISEITTEPILAQLCTGETIEFSATDFTSGGSFLNYNWDFANGETGTNQVETISYDAGGNYQVQLVFEEAVSGCKDSLTSLVSVQDYPDAEFETNVDDLEELCFPQNIIFSNTTAGSAPVTFQWDFGNGQSATGSSPATVYEKGTFTTEMIVTTSFGCADTVYRDFTLVGPEGSFVIDRNTICKGELISFNLVDTADVGSFTWDFGDGIIGENVSPISHQYNFNPPSGQTVAKLILRGENDACPFSLEEDIFIHEVIADFIRNNGLDTAICFAPYPLEQEATGADNIFWDFGDGTFGSDNDFIHEFPEPGSYDVSLAVENESVGCVDTVTKTVVLHEFPEVLAKGDTVCQGDTGKVVVLNHNINSIYTWTPDVALSDANIHDPLAAPLEDQLYQVQETNEYGCEDSITVSFNVIKPFGDLDWDTSVVIGDFATLPVLYDTDYILEWNPEEGLSCLDCSFPEVQGLEDMIYTLGVKDVFGCFESDLQFRVNVLPNTFIAMPTTFTPNGDNANDVVYVEGWGIKSLQLFEIYNRWGEKVYEGTDIEEGWDGYYKGALQNNDVYVYKIVVETWREGEFLTKEGHLNLVK